MDVDAWLDSIEPGKFDEWLAYRRLKPDPLERIIKILKIGFATICHSGMGGAEIDPDMLDPDNPDKKTAKPEIISPERSQSTFISSYGGKTIKEPV